MNADYRSFPWLPLTVGLFFAFEAVRDDRWWSIVICGGVAVQLIGYAIYQIARSRKLS